MQSDTRASYCLRKKWERRGALTAAVPRTAQKGSANPSPVVATGRGPALPATARTALGELNLRILIINAAMAVTRRANANASANHRPQITYPQVDAARSRILQLAASLWAAVPEPHLPPRQTWSPARSHVCPYVGRWQNGPCPQTLPSHFTEG